MEAYLINPNTGRKIKRNGKTHQQLLAKGAIVRTGKYAAEGLSSTDFCGPAGGARPGSYPVNTPGRARAAKAYAHYAPNPEGIRQCADSKEKRMGWTSSSSSSKKKKGKKATRSRSKSKSRRSR